MNQSSRLHEFFSHYDPKVKTSIIELCKTISATKADLFILMARKAACFFDCLNDLGLVQFDGLVASDRILEMNCSWLKDKNVVIIDDAIISGTTLYESIQKLKELGVGKISVFVLAINKRYFQPDLLCDAKGESYLRKPHQVLEDPECIKMCADIIGSLSKFTRPYSVDFPLFKNVTVDEKDLIQMLQTDDWEIDDISTTNQQLSDITVLTLSPKKNILEYFDNLIGVDMSKISISKIRLYIRKGAKDETNLYLITILPVVVLKPIYEANIEKVFYHLSDHKSGRFKQHFTTTISQIHFVQYVTAGILANIWQESMSMLIPKMKTLHQDSFNDSLLFNPFVSKLIYNSVSFHFKGKHENKIIKDIKTISDNNIDEEIPVWETTTTSILGMQAMLCTPFIKLFQDCELESRALVLKHGKEVFQIPEFKEKVDRLKRGYSVNYLSKLLDAIDLGHDAETNRSLDKNKFVSLFLDKSIDLGIVVPIVAVRPGSGGAYYYRAYRHGEDVIFGEMEFLLCTQLLEAFIISSKRPDHSIPHLAAEKLIVLFLKLGIQKQVFTEFIGNLSSIRSLKVEGIASVRNHLFGQVSTFRVLDKNSGVDVPVYLTQETKSTWITEKLLRKKLLTKDKKTRFYQIGETDYSVIDQAKKLEAIIVGSFFGELMDNTDKAILKVDDLVTLTSCLNFRDIAGSLAAEMVIFNGYWSDFYSYFNNNNNNPYRYFLIASNMRTNYNWISFTAINSGQDKYCRFKEGKAEKLIENVRKRLEEKNPRDAATWLTMWSANLSQHNSEIAGNEVSSIIENEGKWLLRVNFLYRCLEFALRKVAFIEQGLINNKNKSFLTSLVNLNYDSNDISADYMIHHDNFNAESGELSEKELDDISTVKNIEDHELLELLKKQNANLLVKLGTEINSFKIKLQTYKVSSRFKFDNFCNVDTPFETLDTNELRTLIWEAFENLNELFKESKLIISDVDRIAKPYGIPAFKLEYSDAIHFDYLDTEQAAGHLFSDIKTYVRKNKDQLFNISKKHANEVSCFFVDGRDTSVKRGLWLFIGNAPKEEIISSTVKIWSNFSQNDLRLSLFKNLTAQHKVSRTELNSKNINWNFFWTLAKGFIPTSISALVDFDLQIITHKAEYQSDSRLVAKTSADIRNDLATHVTSNRLFSETPFPHEAVVLTCDFIPDKSSKKKPVAKKKSIPTTETIVSAPELFGDSTPRFDIGIIAIKETELGVLLKGLDNVVDDVPARSAKKYYGATLAGKYTTHKIVFCKQPDMGNLNSANMYNLMKDDFNPPLVIVFGTAGAYADKADICDVIIPTKVIYYEMGKDTKEKFKHEVNVFTVHENFKDHFLTDFFARNGGDEINLAAVPGSLKPSFTLMQGAMGSGEQISENPDSDMRAWLRNVDRKSVAFEMETAGAMGANEFENTYTNTRNLGVLPIRALTDHGDPNKTTPGIENFRVPGLENALLVIKQLFATVPDLNKFLDQIYNLTKRA